MSDNCCWRLFITDHYETANKRNARLSICRRVAYRKKLIKTIELLPRPVVADLIREVLKTQKKDLKKDKKPIKISVLFNEIKSSIDYYKRKEISRVINATGIVVHTNLGRAPLSESLFDSVKASVTGYGNIEFDSSNGKRGKRGRWLSYIWQLSQALRKGQL